MMKFFSAVLLSIFFSSCMNAQVKTPVEWVASATKIDARTYELHLTATLNKGWHIYSQTTPEGGPVPTTITFTKNPLFDFDGNTKEVGKLEQRHEEIFGVDVKQFSGKVEFIQVIKLRSPVKTSANVSVEYMVCDDKQCLPPVTKKFSIAL